MPRKQRVGCVVWQKLVSRQGGWIHFVDEVGLFNVTGRCRQLLYNAADPSQCRLPTDDAICSKCFCALLAFVLKKFCTAEEFFLKRCRVTPSDPIKDRCLCSERRVATVSVVSAFGVLQAFLSV